MTDSIDLDDDTGEVYRTMDGLELGVQDGEGYVIIPTMDGFTYKLSVPKTEVENFLSKRREDRPFPQVPDGFEDSLPAPNGFTGGDAEHTGGSIYCRIWRKDIDGGHLEVMYGVPDCNGVDLSLFDDEMRHKGVIDQVGVEKETDYACFEKAKTFMQRVEEGYYQAEIEEKLGEDDSEDSD